MAAKEAGKPGLGAKLSRISTDSACVSSDAGPTVKTPDEAALLRAFRLSGMENQTFLCGLAQRLAKRHQEGNKPRFQLITGGKR